MWKLRCINVTRRLVQSVQDGKCCHVSAVVVVVVVVVAVVVFSVPPDLPELETLFHGAENAPEIGWNLDPRLELLLVCLNPNFYVSENTNTLESHLKVRNCGCGLVPRNPTGKPSKNFPDLRLFDGWEEWTRKKYYSCFAYLPWVNKKNMCIPTAVMQQQIIDWNILKQCMEKIQPAIKKYAENPRPIHKGKNGHHYYRL